MFFTSVLSLACFASLFSPNNAQTTTDTIIEVNSVYICDPGFGDPEVFVRVRTPDYSPIEWETSIIEASESYELLEWDTQRTYSNQEVLKARFKIYDDDFLGPELRGEEEFDFAADLNFANDIARIRLSQTFIKGIYYDGDSCYENLTFTITYINDVTILPTELPSGAPSLPSTEPSEFPSDLPSELPSDLPSSLPSKSPTNQPTEEAKMLGLTQNEWYDISILIGIGCVIFCILICFVSLMKFCQLENKQISSNVDRGEGHELEMKRVHSGTANSPHSPTGEKTVSLEAGTFGNGTSINYNSDTADDKSRSGEAASNDKLENFCDIFFDKLCWFLCCCGLPRLCLKLSVFCGNYLIQFCEVFCLTLWLFITCCGIPRKCCHSCSKACEKHCQPYYECCKCICCGGCVGDICHGNMKCKCCARCDWVTRIISIECILGSICILSVALIAVGAALELQIMLGVGIFVLISTWICIFIATGQCKNCDACAVIAGCCAGYGAGFCCIAVCVLLIVGSFVIPFFIAIFVSTLGQVAGVIVGIIVGILATIAAIIVCGLILFVLASML